MKVSIVGVTGYSGLELVRLLNNHKNAEIVSVIRGDVVAHNGSKEDFNSHSKDEILTLIDTVLREETGKNVTIDFGNKYFLGSVNIGNNGTAISNMANGDINATYSQTINDPSALAAMLTVLKDVRPASEDGRQRVKEIETELYSGNARTGKIQKALDWLERTCKSEKVQSAIGVFKSLFNFLIAIIDGSLKVFTNTN